MFKCALLNHQSEPGERAVRIVVETREVTYPARVNAHRAPGGYKPVSEIDDRSPETRKRLRKFSQDDPGGKGREIVREILACAKCAASPIAEKSVA